MRQNILFLVLALYLSSCAFAPMNSSKTARSIPKDETIVDFGFSPFPYGTISSGLAPKLTLSGSIEQQLFPLVAAALRYSFIDRSQGFSLAFELGTSLGMGIAKSYSGFGGPIFSWRKDWLETYFYPKFTFVSLDKLELSSEDKDHLFVDSISAGEVSYLLNALGATWWVKPKIGLNLEIKYMVLLSEPGEVRHDIIPSIGFMIGF